MIRRKVVNKGGFYGETDLDSKTIKINKKLHKTKPTHKTRYPELLDTIVHEEAHMKHPKWTEKEVRKFAGKEVKRMKTKEKSKLYAKYK